MNADMTLETTGQDWANHISHETSGNGASCLAALLSGKPDEDALRLAIDDLIDMQPVLGCRFDDARPSPVWTPARGAAFFETLDADDLCGGLNAFMRGDPVRDAAMKAALVATPGETALCLALDHAAVDGGGAKRCLSLLIDCYNARLSGRRPDARVCADRSDAPVFARCGLSDPRAAIRREAPASGAPATVPFIGTDGRQTEYRWLSLPLSAVRRPGGTVNDRLIAALAMALSARRTGRERTEIHLTVDLRRYLDDASAPAAANLSGMESVVAEVLPESSYERVVEEVRAQTSVIKSGRPGISGAAMMTYMRTMPYAKARVYLTGAGEKSRASGVAAPILSNLGLVAPGALALGGIAVRGVVPLLPAMRAPAFMLGACGYGGELTISAGFYAGERAGSDVGRLLEDIRDRLIGETVS